MDAEAPAILTVDWDAAGRTPPAVVQNAVEYYGTKHAGERVDGEFPEEWMPGGSHWGILSNIIDEHGAWNVPGHGALDTAYANLISTGGLEDALRAYRGDEDVLERFPLLTPLDPALKTHSTSPAVVPNASVAVDSDAARRTTDPTDHEYSLENTDFGAELHALVDSAAYLDDTIGDFVDPAPNADRIDGHPALRTGQYGPDCLGNIYIMLCVSETDPETLELDSLPISIEETRPTEMVDGTEVILRHERYVDIAWASEPWGERTHEFFEEIRDRAGFIDAASFYWVSEDTDAMVEEQTGLIPSEQDVEFPPESSETIPVYEPPPEVDPDEELRWLTLLPNDDTKQPVGVYTESPPTPSDVLLSALLVDIESALRSGEAQAVYECQSCGEWTHWLGTCGVRSSPGELLDRIDHAHARECGCNWQPDSSAV